MKLEYLLLGVAYTLLLVAALPELAKYDSLRWELVPVWLMLVGYAASLMRYTIAKTDQEERRLARVSWLAWITYFSLAIIWPLPLHWYDALIITALLISPEDLRSNALVALYYLLGSATAMQDGAVLQLCGKLLLASVTAVGAARSLQHPQHQQDLKATAAPGDYA